MNKMKYVMFEDDTFVIFPATISHKSFINFKRIHSAGFVDFFETQGSYSRIIQCCCFGESSTLGKLCDKEHDEWIINYNLNTEK